jgi:hypothetical protein
VLTSVKNPTTVQRKSERELVVTRSFTGPARIMFEHDCDAIRARIQRWPIINLWGCLTHYSDSAPHR